MSQTTELYLITAGEKIRCRRCKARSSRTKLQCAKPALKGKMVETIARVQGLRKAKSA